MVKFNKNSKVLQLEGCFNDDYSEWLISEFSDSVVKLPANNKLIAPLIIMNKFPLEFSLCRDVSIKIIDYKNTGFRKSKDIKWVLISSDPVNAEID